MSPVPQTHGDGFTLTCDLVPVACACCGDALAIACPNGCDASDSVPHTFVAARDTKTPRQRRPGTYQQGSGPLILTVLAMFPHSTAREVALRLTLPIGRVSVMLAKLERDGKVTGVLPPLLKRGKRYHVVEGVTP